MTLLCAPLCGTMWRQNTTCVVRCCAAMLSRLVSWCDVSCRLVSCGISFRFVLVMHAEMKHFTMASGATRQTHHTTKPGRQHIMCDAIRSGPYRLVRAAVVWWYGHVAMLCYLASSCVRSDGASVWCACVMSCGGVSRCLISCQPNPTQPNPPHPTVS